MSEILAKVIYASGNGLTAAMLLVLALISLRQRPRRGYLTLWAAFCLAGALYAAAALVATLVHAAAVGLVAVRLAATCGSVATFLFFCFALSFTGPLRGERLLRGVALLWLLSVQPLLWLTGLVMTTVRTSFANFMPQAGPLMPWYTAFSVFCWTVPIGLVIRTFRHSSGLKRIQASYMLLGFMVASLAALASILPGPLKSFSLLLPLFPLIITTGMIRHRLWDVRTIIHRTAVWLLLSAGLLLPLALILHLGWPHLAALPAGAQALALLLLFLLGHLYLRAVKPPLDRLFQRGQVDQQMELDRFGRTMAHLSSPSSVVAHLFSTVDQTLFPERLVLDLRRRAADRWSRYTRATAGAPAVPSPEAPVKEERVFLRVLGELGEAVDRDQLASDLRLQASREEAERYFVREACQVCLPLVLSGELVGLLHLGAKQSLRPYVRGDLEFLERLAAPAAIGLANALLFDQVDLQRQELERLAASLEERVKERTQELAAVNAQLAQANQHLRELDQVKRRFFANVSHELRTPLTLILSPVELLLAGRAGPISDEGRGHLQRITRNARSLLGLINDLLDLSRHDELRLVLKPGPLDLARLLETLVEAARPHADRQGITLHLEGPSSLPFEGDGERLERVASNLLGNALKFTGPGGEIRVRWGARGEAVWFAVADTGVGIPAAELPLIFDRFHQVASTAQRSGGVGIGLALVKELVELHQGTVRVASTPGQGTRFTVELPRGAAMPPAAELLAESVVAPVARRPPAGEALVGESEPPAVESAVPSLVSATAETLLVVEDNVEVRRVLVELLAGRFRIVEAGDGAAGLEAARRELPALILCDVMMPVMDGLALCRQLKAEARTAAIPLIMLTARQSPEDVVSAFAAGADDYVTKPFAAEELFARIGAQRRIRQLDQAMARAERMAALGSTAAGLAHEIKNPLNAILNGLQVLEGQEGEARQRLLEVVLRSARRILEVVESFQSFVRLDEAAVQPLDLARSVEDALSILGHRMAGITVHRQLALTRTVEGNGALINQVLMNLLGNAVDAVGEQGEIWIETSATEEAVTLRLRDSGPGIRAEDRERVFLPFFTGKPVGQGTGMGLALAKQVVEQHGGTLRVTSPPGAGAEFTLELPLEGRAITVSAERKR